LFTFAAHGCTRRIVQTAGRVTLGSPVDLTRAKMVSQISRVGTRRSLGSGGWSNCVGPRDSVLSAAALDDLADDVRKFRDSQIDFPA
jgi:hypothetical protein